MMRNKRILIGGFLVALLLSALSQVWAYPDAIHKQPSDVEVLRNLFIHPECERACYLGIEPGKTSVEEAENILSEHEIAYKLGDMSFDWNDEAVPFHNPGYRFRAMFDHGMIEQVGLYLNLTRQLVIDAFGNPDHVALVDNLEGYDFIYLTKGMAFQFGDDDLVFHVRLAGKGTYYQSTLTWENGNLADQACVSYGIAPCIAPTATSIFAPTHP